MTPCSARIRFAATRSSTRLIAPLLSDWSMTLVRLDAGRRDHAGPALKLAPHERAEALGAAAYRDHSLLGEQLAHVRLLQERAQLGVDLVDHRLARPGWGEHSVPSIHFQIRKAHLFEGRDFGEHLRALGAHDRQHAKLPALNVGRDGLEG